MAVTALTPPAAPAHPASSGADSPTRIGGLSLVVNALTTMLPAATGHIFSEFLAAGNLLNAVGIPLALATGLQTVALGVETFVVLRNLPGLLADFNALF